jgi:hypothetical protein
MVNMSRDEDLPVEAEEELESGAAAAAAYGQVGLPYAGIIGSAAAGAIAEDLAADNNATDDEFLKGSFADNADAGDDFAGEGNSRAEGRSEDRGIDAGPAIQNQG